MNNKHRKKARNASKARRMILKRYMRDRRNYDRFTIAIHATPAIMARWYREAR